MSLSPELRNRVLTGGGGAILLLLLICFGGWVGVFLFVTVMSLTMVYEFIDMVFSMPDRSEKRYVLLSVSWLVLLFNRITPQSEFPILMGCFLLLFIYFLVTAKRHDELALTDHFKELAFSLFSQIYLVMIPAYLLKIYEGSNGLEWTVLFLLIVWASDIAAYFAGKHYGKTKLYPRISPKKTVEGAIGGVVAAVFVTLVFKLSFFRALSWSSALLLPIPVTLFAQTGDFCESFLKRAFARKDSGSILPGHGGFLDRFDGVVFSLPVMYACIRLFS